jgi:hypothetical protein
MESIVSHCHLAITFWMHKDGRPRATSGRNRNDSRLHSNQTVHVDMNIDTGMR